MRPRVGLYGCPNYDPELIRKVLAEAFLETPSWLEGLEGKRIFLKLNLLMKKRPEEAVTTHSAVVEALVRILQERGAAVVLGDSPGGPYTVGRLKAIYRECGLEEVVKRTGAQLNYDLAEVTVSFPSGRVAKSFHVIKPLLEADRVISVSKLKTHQMTRFTGAVKNLFGAIPGLKKADYHLKMVSVSDFSELLVDLALCINPSLHIMDAITAMEGKGPSAGRPRQVGALLVSKDPFALDVVALSLIGVNPMGVPTVARGKARGKAGDPAEIEITGRSLHQWQIKDFQVPGSEGHVRFPIPDFLVSILRPKPVFVKEKCAGCGECVASCPPGALTLEKGLPHPDLQACIRCFCCQELCPHQAVEIQRNPLGRLLE